MNKSKTNLAYLYSAISRRGSSLRTDVHSSNISPVMKKKNRPPRSSRTQTRGSVGEDNGAPVNRGRPRKNHSGTTANLDKDDASKDKTEGPAAADVAQKDPDVKAKSSGKNASVSSRFVTFKPNLRMSTSC